MKSLLLLLGMSVVLWAILLAAGWLTIGEEALLLTMTAVGLCLLPALATLAWFEQGKQSSELQLAAILGGSGVRMAVALGGGLVLTAAFPETFRQSFLLWVGVAYIGVLTLEILLILKFNPSPGD